MISVVIPTYNSSSTIQRALESLVCQSDMNFEVLIVDDHSEDYRTVKRVIKEYSDTLRISFYRLRNKANGAVARNYGIHKVNTPYICFLDSDDFWVDNRIELAYKSIRRARNRFLVEYSCYQIPHTGYVSSCRELRTGELVSEYVFFRDMPMQTSTFLISTEIAKRVLFDEELSRHQDSSFMMRAQSMGYSISFTHAITSNYVFRKSDFSERVKSKRITTDFCEEFLKSYSNYFSKKGELGYLFNVYLRVALISRRDVFKVVAKLMLTGQYFALIRLSINKIVKRIVSI